MVQLEAVFLESLTGSLTYVFMWVTVIVEFRDIVLFYYFPRISDLYSYMEKQHPSLALPLI